MNAKQASELARKVNTETENSQYAEIQEVIQKAAKRGDYSAYFFSSLKYDVQRKLESEGFTISSYTDQREGTTVTITWNEK